MIAETYTGTPCKRAGHTERYRANHICVACSHQYKMAYYVKNKSAVLEKCAAYRIVNREQLLARRKIYYLANRDVLKAKNLARQKANRKDANRRSRIWRARHPEKAKEKETRWKRENPALRAVHDYNRRSRLSAAPGQITHQDVTEQYFMQNGRCFYCCKSIARGNFHRDHIIPLSKGGTNYRHNLALTCKRCNLSKMTRSAIDYVLGLVS